MKLVWRFVREPGWTSSAIALFSAGHPSHVGLILDGQELGARFDKAGGKPSGVYLRPMDYAKFSYEDFITLEVTDVQGNDVLSFLHGQIGRKYDWRAIVAFAENRDWHDQNAWICSELQAAAVESQGLCHKLYVQTNKITPTAFGLILSAIGGKIGSINSKN